MSITLHAHQRLGLEKLRESLWLNRSVLFRAECGYGKTVVASYIVDKYRKAGLNVWFICHRKELIKQASSTFEKFGIDYSVIQGNRKPDFKKKVFICSIDTLKYNNAARVYNAPYPSLVIWDECHHIGASGWERVKLELDCIADYRGVKKTRHIGLSATPERNDGQGLGEYFQDMVITEDAEWLIKNGYLSDYKLYSSDFHVKAAMRFGDYDNKALEAETNKTYISENIAEQWLTKANGLPTIGYAVNISHAYSLADRFKSKGVQAVAIDYKTPEIEKIQAFRAFADGNLKVIFNKDLFGEGLDISALTGTDASIECVIAARKIKSLALHRQQIFRCLRRRKNGNPGIILDTAGNCLNPELGVPDSDIKWTLDSKKRSKRGEAEKLPLVMRCQSCFLPQKPAVKCKACGHENKTKQIKIKEKSGELIEISKEDAKKILKKENKAAQSYDDLIKLAYSRGYKNPVKWATMMINYRKGVKKYGYTRVTN